MKILNVILVLLIGLSCDNSENDKLPLLLKSIPINTVQDFPSTIEDFEIHIQYFFQDDTITIKIDDKKIFNGAVTSEPVLSLAHILYVELDRGDHQIIVKMDDKFITESFTFNDEMVIGVIYYWMEDELRFRFYEDGERPMYD